jgi:Lar family restriction alleviation protein
MSELKPCPFCGQTVGYVTSLYGYRVVCDVCDIHGPRGVTAEVARDEWNHRAEASALTPSTDAHCAKCECAQTPCECAARLRELETALTAALAAHKACKRELALIRKLARMSGVDKHWWAVGGVKI